MNGIQPPVGQSRGDGSPLLESNASSPVSARAPGARSRKRGSDDFDDKESKRAVKRACNECRQQKLRCDVVQEPTFHMCTRCRRHGLDCNLDPDFKRTAKRMRYAELELENQNLRDELEEVKSKHGIQQGSGRLETIASQDPVSRPLPRMDQYIGSEEAVASLLDLKAGLEGGSFMRSPNGRLLGLRQLEDVSLTHDQVRLLFKHYFQIYHPFLPILEQDLSPDAFYEASPLLFWIVIAVASRRETVVRGLLSQLTAPFSRLLWSAIAEVPQSHNVAKALAIICTWPFPFKSSSSDPTLILSGIMMKVALQIGLHRPSHAQDFTKFRIELREEELKDRIRTWMACNIVAQRVATGYGQPPSTYIDWVLAPPIANESSPWLNFDTQARLRIEQFSNKVTQTLYMNAQDPVGLADDSARPLLIALLNRNYQDLGSYLEYNPSPINTLYFGAAGLHFRLSAFFDSPASNDYSETLLDLWMAATSFLENALALEKSQGTVLAYCTNYILQMIVAAGFTLMKLLNSFFATIIDVGYGKKLFARTIEAVRQISITQNDLPERLAEVLAQLWRHSGAGSRLAHQEGRLGNSLQLKVRCRMSLSLVYDSVWRWREELQGNGSNLETALKNPTNPDVESSASSTADGGLAPPGAVGGAVTPGPSNTYGEANYEVFDPLNWMLDGLVDWPYSFSSQGLDNQGML